LNRVLASKIVESLSAQYVPDAVYEDMREFGIAEWQETLWWLSGSGLPHYFVARLQQSCREKILPSDIHATLSGNFLANHQRVDTMAAEFENLTRRLCEAGVNCAAVRGFELAPEYCPNLWLRTWYAHEYIISAEQLRYASRIVEEAGYPFRRSGSRGELYFAVPEMQTPSKVEDAYRAAFPRMVVLHCQIWDQDSTGINIPVPDNLLRRVVTRRSLGISFPTLSDEDLLAFTLIDTFARVLSYWCKLSWLFEISHYLQMRHSDERFWETFYGRIADWGKLPEISDFVFLLCANIFGVALPEYVRYRVSGLNPALALWTRHYGIQWALAKYPGSKLSLLVQRELVSDRGTWNRLRRRKLFPFLSDGTAMPSNIATSTKHEQPKRKMSRVVDRIRFHGPATYAYLRELPRWKRLLAQGR